MTYASDYGRWLHGIKIWLSGLTNRADIMLALVMVSTGAEMLYQGVTWTRASVIGFAVLSLIILRSLAQQSRHTLSQPFYYVPYLFGLYLFFIEGFFRLTQLLASFSMIEVVQVIFYFIAGSSVASIGYNAYLQKQKAH